MSYETLSSKLLVAKTVTSTMQNNTIIIDGELFQSDDIVLVSNWSLLQIESVERTFILNAFDNVKSKNKDELTLKYSIIYNLKDGTTASVSFYFKEN